MYDPGMQEYRDDESPPLVWLVASIPEVCDAGLIWDTAIAAELGQRACQAPRVERSSVWTRPRLHVIRDYLVDVVHAGRES
jgi:hypothetical protein